MLLKRTGQDTRGQVMVGRSDELHPLKHRLCVLSDFGMLPPCDFRRAVCSALPNSSNLLLFNQLSGSLLNFSHLLIYCEG